MLECIVVGGAADCKEVETHLVGKSALFEEGIGGAHHIEDFLVVDSLEGVFVAVSTGLDLGNHEQVVAQGYQAIS